MKNNIIKICFIVLVLFSSCDSWLDVQPKDKVKSEKMFKNESGFKQALTGAYILLSDPSIYGQNSTFLLMDAMANLYSFKENDELTNYLYAASNYNYSNRSVNGKINNIWNKSYETICNLSAMLEQLDNQSFLSEDRYNVLKGEALGLRAFLHFDLLRLFGPGNLKNDATALSEVTIPYVTKYSRVASPRKEAKEVIDLIIADIDNSIELLYESDYFSFNPNKQVEWEESSYYANSRQYRFNYLAALTLKTRVYMWIGDYESATKIVEDLVKNSNIEWVNSEDLTGSEDTRDKTFTEEYIFGIDVHDLQNVSNVINYFTIVDNQNELTMYLPYDRCNNMYEVNSVGSSDLRYNYVWKEIGGKYYFRRYIEPEGYTKGNTVALMKKCEPYYMLAECLNQNDARRKDGVAYLNKVRKARAIVEELPEDISKEDLKQEIIKEYWKEMYGEGQLFYLIKRLGLYDIPYTSIKIQSQDLVLPIPKNELNFGL